jgi:hypothetical protein
MLHEIHNRTPNVRRGIGVVMKQASPGSQPNCWEPALSEPDVTVSRHTAQAFERLFRGDAVSRRKEAGDKPSSTLDEVRHGSRRRASRPARGGRENEDANP